jgi:hypothetical protein
MADIKRLIATVRRHAERCEAMTGFADARIAARSAEELADMEAVAEILEALDCWSETESAVRSEGEESRRLIEILRG